MFIALPICPLSGRKNNKIEFFYRFYYRFAVTAVVILVELVFEGSGPVVRFVVENAKTGSGGRNPEPDIWEHDLNKG